MSTKYLSSEPVTHLFDQLPTDMIYYEIFPYLDYNSRVTANLLLPLHDRLRTPLRKDAVLEFTILFGSTIITSLIKKQGITTNGIARNRLSLKIWRTVPLFPELFQYNYRFRNVIAAKAAEFCDPSTYEFTQVSAYTRKALTHLCEAVLLSLETSHPYKRDLAASFPRENWSAVCL
jgi:hypothetical protein